MMRMNKDGNVPKFGTGVTFYSHQKWRKMTQNHKISIIFYFKEDVIHGRKNYGE